MTPPTFDTSSLIALKGRVEYEAWLLEAVYHISSNDLFPQWPDAAIYPISGAPKFIASMRGRIDLGDWRPGFLKVGAPLVFGTSFKLLDMLIEWILVENGASATFRFQEKLAALTPNVRFPPVIESRLWWRERLIGLYRTLEPLRGTIIHERRFATDNGELVVASSKRGVIGTPVFIGAAKLRILARCAVGALRYIDGSWILDPHRERAIRHDLDLLSALHGEPSLGQKRPYHPTVRVYSKNADPRTADVVAIARDLATRYPDCDYIFDLRFLFVEEERVTRAYLFDSGLTRSDGARWPRS
ncbi:MAG: hypothetical protein IPK74_00085 [Deltaproteobacteria bacterium]|nr:hypothetical protein [Deltaproteobacteria bacterium]